MSVLDDLTPRVQLPEKKLIREPDRLAYLRDRVGRWVKGTRSPNPGGRPGGFDALVRELTADGEELVLLTLGVARGELGAPRRYVYEDGRVEVRLDGDLPNLDQMAEARRWLADRGWGKAPETLHVERRDVGEAQVDLRTLTTEQLRLLAEIARQARPDEKVVDVQVVDATPAR